MKQKLTCFLLSLLFVLSFTSCKKSSEITTSIDDGDAVTTSSVKPESSEPALPDAQTIFMNFLNNTLIPEKGLCDLMNQSITISGYNQWCETSGIISAKIVDLNRDGIEEMAVTYIKARPTTENDVFLSLTDTGMTEERDLCLSVYILSESQPELASDVTLISQCQIAREEINIYLSQQNERTYLYYEWTANPLEVCNRKYVVLSFDHELKAVVYLLDSSGSSGEYIGKINVNSNFDLNTIKTTFDYHALNQEILFSQGWPTAPVEGIYNSYEEAVTQELSPFGFTMSADNKKGAFKMKLQPTSQEQLLTSITADATVAGWVTNTDSTIDVCILDRTDLRARLAQLPQTDTSSMEDVSVQASELPSQATTPIFTLDEIKRQILQHYNDARSDDGTYVIFDDDVTDNGDTFYISVRYQMSDSEAEELLAAGGFPSANVIYASLTVNKNTGVVDNGYGEQWTLEVGQ